MFISKEKFIKVDDDWFPCYKGNTVRVVICCAVYDGGDENNTSCPGQSYIWVEGADDDNMEIRFRQDIADRDYLLKKYAELKNIYDNLPEVANHKWFKEHGFYRG